VIRNVCIHVQNEQPLLADLYAIPTAADAGVLCTNVRMMDGKRPVFIDSIEATFFFPYHVIRFIEVPEGAFDGRTVAASSADDLADLPALRLPVPVATPDGAADEADPDLELEIDEGFLQRIRDI
jgi:hypothetical protein